MQGDRLHPCKHCCKKNPDEGSAQALKQRLQRLLRLLQNESHAQWGY